MQTMPDAYNTAFASGAVNVEVIISVGTGIDQTSADDVTSITGGLLALSNTAQASDAVYYITDGLATFEGDGIPTALSNRMKAPPLSAVSYPPEAGLWSDAISDADGAIDWTLTIALSQDHTSALTIYTDGPAITAGTATFTAADGTVATESLDCTSDYARVSTAHTYSTIAINITGISEAYRHVRIVEVEYGASKALSTSTLTGEVTLIQEIDPTEKTIPTSELDFQIINVDGLYDPDNPDGELAKYALGTPITVSCVAKTSDAQWSVPMGRYWIGERSATDTELSISAFDGRWMLTQSSASWSLATGTSLGASIESMLADMGIPHSVDEDLYSVYPDADYTFEGEDVDRLSDMLWIEQAYGIYLIPQRDGTLKVTQSWYSGTAPDLPVARETAWPRARQNERFNGVSVNWYSDSTVTTVETDLRADSTEVRDVLQIIGNRLISTSDRAAATMDRIAGRLVTDEIEVGAFGDPAVDVGDVMGIPGRWTQDAPASYTVRYIEWTWDGLFTATIRAYD